MKGKFYIEPSAHVLIAGATGTGKSFLAENYLRGYENVIKLDTKRETEERRLYGLSPWDGLEEGEDFTVCESLDECASASTKKIIYCPEFEEQTPDAINDFFEWVFLRQNTILWIDELMSISSVNRYPPALHKIMIMGRSKNVGVWACTQRPSGIPTIVPANCKYFFIFNLYLKADRKKLAEITGFEEIMEYPNGYNFWFCKVGQVKPTLAYLDTKE